MKREGLARAGARRVRGEGGNSPLQDDHNIYRYVLRAVLGSDIRERVRRGSRYERSVILDVLPGMFQAINKWASQSDCNPQQSTAACFLSVIENIVLELGVAACRQTVTNVG